VDRPDLGEIACARAALSGQPPAVLQRGELHGELLGIHRVSTVARLSELRGEPRAAGAGAIPGGGRYGADQGGAHPGALQDGGAAERHCGGRADERLGRDLHQERRAMLSFEFVCLGGLGGPL